LKLLQYSKQTKCLPSNTKQRHLPVIGFWLVFLIIYMLLFKVQLESQKNHSLLQWWCQKFLNSLFSATKLVFLHNNS